MSAPFGMAIISPPADRLLSEGDRFDAAGFSFEIREIPGHSPGSIIYIRDQYDPPFVFVGDVIFDGSVGRTDMGGNTGAASLRHQNEALQFTRRSAILHPATARRRPSARSRFDQPLRRPECRAAPDRLSSR